MSTEQKPPQPVPHHKEHLETTALGETLIGGWAKFKQGQLISYKWMGIILIAVTAIVVIAYIWSEKTKVRSQLWVELESQNSPTALKDFAKNNPDTMAGRVAEFDLARVLLGPDGIEKLPTARDEAERKRALDNIDAARELMTKLIDQFKDEPILRVQCYMGMAKSEAALIGLAKDGSVESRGSVGKLIEWLNKVSEAADGTPWGDDAKKLAEALKGGKAEELTNVQRYVYKLDAPFSGGGPLAPGGGFPGVSGLPGLSGIPGSATGGPIAPSPTPPPISPMPESPKAPDPKAPDPKAPEPPKK